jgi:hypothetical protein
MLGSSKTKVVEKASSSKRGCSIERRYRISR